MFEVLIALRLGCDAVLLGDIRKDLVAFFLEGA
jgi:hypothetical protein